ncbi:MAG TPA: glycine--tRNA ligase subunit beta [Terriglobales bacterium]|nr:glycine--tRNA ligase subunit beta [Terriglobales bacterium]
MADFLLEIGCEEIPARMIDAASAELARRVSDVLKRERLTATPVAHVFSTPRRLAVVVSDVSPAQADVEEQVIGPSVKVAFKDGQPTPAAHGFSKKVNIDVSRLQRVMTPKGECLAANVVSKGRRASQIFAESLPKELASIYWPKSMYWRAKNERFVRPVRWLVALLDGEVVPLEFDGTHAGRESSGHRSLGGPVKLSSPRDYESHLQRVGVVASRAEREQRIRKALDEAARTVQGARWREDAELLATVTNLTEFPSVILGNFDTEFLELPEEVLVTVMRDHQKYFALQATEHKLLPHFLAVLNTDGDPEGIIRHGHERVLRARFNDARFFWQTDQKISLRERVSLLRHVIFQKDLGSYYDKTLRVQHLASHISGTLKQAGVEIRPGVVHKAACLAKTDLTTELVKEFTELQGIVGGLYAQVQELDRDLAPDAHRLIAQAIYDHYKPESIEDSAPRTIEGAVLSIADKADSIAGMFALGLQPSGSKDPFALRRQANGIVKTIAEHKLPLNIEHLFRDALAEYAGSHAEKKFGPKFATAPGQAEVLQAIVAFCRERLEFYLRDVLGFAYDVVNAVLAAGSDDVVDAVARAQAVATVRPSPDFESISIAFKRMKNIWRQAHEAGSEPAADFHPGALKEPAEVNLAELIPATAQRVQELRAKKNYEPALVEISRLRPAVDTFFDKVMVMVDETKVRANRLALLQTVLREFSTIADFSEIVTESKDSTGSKES